MTAFDLYFLAILFAFTLGGFLSGLIHKLFGLIALIAAIWAGMRLGGFVEPLLLGFVHDPMLRSLISAVLSSLLVSVVFIVLGNVLAKAVRSSALAPVDRMLGLLLGAAQAVVVIGAVVLIGQQFKVDRKDWWRNAAFKHSGEQAAYLLDRIVDFRALSGDWIDADLRQKMDDGRLQAEGLLDEMSGSPKSGKE